MAVFMLAVQCQHPARTDHHVRHSYIVSAIHHWSPQTKRQVNRFSRFCRAH